MCLCSLSMHRVSQFSYALVTLLIFSAFSFLSSTFAFFIKAFYSLIYSLLIPCPVFYCPSSTLSLRFLLPISSNQEIAPFCIQIHWLVRVKLTGRKTAKRTGPGGWQLPGGKRAALLLPLPSPRSTFQEQWERKEEQSTTSTDPLCSFALL